MPNAGVAEWFPTEVTPPDMTFRARYPGSAGNVTVTLRFKLGENIRHDQDGVAELRGVRSYDVVLATRITSPAVVEAYWLERTVVGGRVAFQVHAAEGSSGGDPRIDELGEVRLLTVSVSVSAMGRFGEELVWENLAFDPRHKQSLIRVFEDPPSRVLTALYVPLTFTSTLNNGAAIAMQLLQRPYIGQNSSPAETVFDVIEAFFLASHTEFEASPFVNPDFPSANRLTVQGVLEHGTDGGRPSNEAYVGDEDGPSGLKVFEDLEDISIIAAPGSSHRDNNETSDRVRRELIKHCESMRYRVAVLDARDGAALSEVKQTRASLDSTRAALYYPWIRVYDPVTDTEVMQPPSGYLSGIYARNDVLYGVHKSPANEVIRSALGFEFLINKAQQEVLNPEGINCLRFFEGRGFRVWGARTISSDPEWKYLNVRRYFAFLERTIEKGTQWAVFENNGDVLWANVRATIEDFLFNEWKENHLFGTKPEEAFFVRCDRTTMTQNDIDNGRMICLIGVAPLRPAEFVIFRIGQKTADAA